jgi:argininosuccinate lyase
MRPDKLSRWCGLWIAISCAAQPALDDKLYRFLIQQNKAQLVVLSEAKLVSPDFARKLADALRDVDRTSTGPGGRRSSNYLDLEDQLVAKVGPEASNIHMGRSRNDLGATSERLVLRDETLELLSLLAGVRANLAALAEKNTDTVIPGFTHAVQAQPTTLAHYLSAFLHSLERDEQRLREAYARINASPLGAAAFTTSGFPLDRSRLAELLGFPAVVENSYDAIMVSTVDSKAELASALAIAALNIGRFAQQFVIQYSDSRPGLNLADDAVGHSSIMPQKRNPRQAERLRILASSVVGEAQTVMLTAHNTPGGEIADIRIHLLDRVARTARDAADMLRTMAEFTQSIRVDPERTLALVNDDYSVMTEFADALLRHARVPFRVGHKAAAEVAAYGRSKGKRPGDLTVDEVAAAYRKATGETLPLSAEQVHAALDPRAFVRGRRGLGGPQPEETARMLQAHVARIADLRRWLEAERARIAAAEQRLETAFARLP